MPPKKPAPGATDPTASASLREEETDDGWVLGGGGGGGGGRPPRPPPRSGTTRPSAGGQGQPPFDPAPDDLVGRYLPTRRSLRCGELPLQIHDADVYGPHPAFLAKVHPPASANGGGGEGDRVEWLFFVCRGRGLGGKRRAGRGAYRLVGEANSRGGGAWYCHSFRYHEDAAGASASRETEWRMDEYGDRGGDDSGAGGAFDMVVCKVYPARGGALHKRPVQQQHSTTTPAAKRAGADVKPQVLVQLYLASRSVGDPLRCRMHHATYVCAVLTGVLPAANDRFEWFFAVRRPRTTEHGGCDDGIIARPRRGGPGQYVPAARYWGVRDREGRDVGYRRVFQYREDDEASRRLARTEWWMEE
ncbi:unnamed protein product [Miscanthus lutarioriparius]|uniref:NAC domain-containing protein n=1 Tax=Miscanthus lutarioriparius TaxID=422564 RepID=A0A811R0F9_9POAL|nr:unnamed protein product [Miscanthus lutarioriparius]